MIIYLKINEIELLKRYVLRKKGAVRAINQAQVSGSQDYPYLCFMSSMIDMRITCYIRAKDTFKNHMIELSDLCDAL